jgi:hypothetical protein
MMLYGRNPVFPSELGRPEPLSDGNTIHDHIKNILQNHVQCDELAQKHLKAQQLKMKERYDKHLTDNKLKVTDIVYVYQPMILMKGTKKKLQKSYHGPYMIMEFRTPKAVILRRLTDGKIIQKSISIKRLKKGHLRQKTNLWDPLPIHNDDLSDLDETDLPTDSFAVTDTQPTADPPVTLHNQDTSYHTNTTPTVQTHSQPQSTPPNIDTSHPTPIFPHKRGRPKKSQTIDKSLGPKIIPPNIHPMRLRTAARRTHTADKLDKAHLT